MTALSDLRVVDATDGVAGGYCARLLAGLGADVIKIERPGTGNALRRAGAFLHDIPNVETSALHVHLGAGTRSITLDTTSRTGAAVLQRLLGTADVFVCDGQRPPNSLATRLPALIVASISPFGLTGPCADWRATDIVSHAAGGYLAMTGDPDREPVKPYGHQAEYQAGVHAAVGILAALMSRDRSGGVAPGVDVSIAEASAFLTGGALARAHVFGRESTRNGTRPVGLPPEYLYPSTIRPCADGHVYVHRHNRFPDLLAAVLQEPRLAAPDVLAQPLGHADETDALLDHWLASRTRRRAVEEAQEARLPFTEVFDPGEVMDDALGQLTARGFFVERDVPGGDRFRALGAPVDMSATPWVSRRAPTLGEHNGEIYREELGISGHDLARLAAAGVI